ERGLRLLVRLSLVLRVVSVFFFYCSVVLRELPSFPTRRSSDLYATEEFPFPETFLHGLIYGKSYWRYHKDGSIAYVDPKERKARSEEHTSELQSRVDLVCRLLLEKKKKAPSSSTPAQRRVVQPG